MSWRDALLARFPLLTQLPPGCYVAGGALRDLALGIAPADVDVAAPNAEAAAQALGKKVIRLGRDQLSAYRVVAGEEVYDFADILENDIDRDLARRDYTVNAMALSLATGELLDPFGGTRDAASRTLRLVRAENFDDDPLRTLRGPRAAVKYGFTIEPATAEAIRARAPRIVDVAPERVTYELSIVLGVGCFRPALDLLHACALDLPLFGRAVIGAEFHADDVTLAGAFALLVADPRAYAERWRWSEQLLRDVLALQRLLARSDRIALFDVGERIARQLPPVLRGLGRDDTLHYPDFTIEPLLDGGTIASLANVPPGPELGRIKRALVEAQVRGKVRTREEAEAFVRSAVSGST